MNEKLRMKDVIDYHTGAIVSKTLIDKENGSVTAFAFDEGQGLSEHTAPYDALVYILEGEAEVTIAGKSHKLNEGDYIIMSANMPHSLRALNRFKMLLVMIKSS
ncbi:MAG: cupin domain-containing protein [Candidatus Methanomethylicaceae archaeon]|nr:cupin domain-containing protein [Candidatus Verstraetearchaeota archaeon]